MSEGAPPLDRTKTSWWGTIWGKPPEAPPPVKRKLADLFANPASTDDPKNVDSFFSTAWELAGQAIARTVQHVRKNDANKKLAACWVVTYIAGRFLHKNISFYSTLTFLAVGLVADDNDLTLKIPETYRSIAKKANTAVGTVRTWLNKDVRIVVGVTGGVVLISLLKNTTRGMREMWYLTMPLAALVGAVAGNWWGDDPRDDD